MLVPFFGKTATVPNMATRAVSVSDQIDVSYCITFQADSVDITMPLCGAGCKVRHLNIFKKFVQNWHFGFAPTKTKIKLCGVFWQKFRGRKIFLQIVKNFERSA
jgi:hypothetical protein